MTPAAESPPLIVIVYDVTPVPASTIDHMANAPTALPPIDCTEANVPEEPDPPAGVPMVLFAVPMRPMITTTFPAVTADPNVTVHCVTADAKICPAS
jgi:hypothetical protein